MKWIPLPYCCSLERPGLPQHADTPEPDPQPRATRCIERFFLGSNEGKAEQYRHWTFFTWRAMPCMFLDIILYGANMAGHISNDLLVYYLIGLLIYVMGAGVYLCLIPKKHPS